MSMTDEQIAAIRERYDTPQPKFVAFLLRDAKCKGCEKGLPTRNDDRLVRYHVTKHSHDHFRGYCYKDMAARYERAHADIAALLEENERLREREAQRRSFAYGNCNIENQNVTREVVDRVADEMDAVAALTKAREVGVIE